MSTARCLLPTARSGFSFTEILFAVMILGIGFIMVAAMFPVALQQTENSTSDTTAASIARSGVTFVTPLGQQTFVSVNPPAVPGVADQNLCVLTPTIRLPSGGGRNAMLLWNNANSPNAAFIANFPTLGAPPLPTSLTIPGDVWPLDISPNARYGGAIQDDQMRSLNGSPLATNQLLFSQYVWPSASQNMIQTGNSRYAWVAFYKRDMFESINAAGTYSFSFAPYAQVIVVALQCRNADAFTTSPAGNSDLTPVTGSLEPTRMDGVSLIAPPSATTTATAIGGIQLPGTPNNTATDPSAPGTFVIIAGDNLATNNVYHGRLNGHVFRIGTRFTGDTNNTWEFVPGFGLSPSDITNLTNMGPSTTFTIYMLGMGRDPNNPANFAGPAMDVAVYSSFIPCPTN